MNDTPASKLMTVFLFTSHLVQQKLIIYKTESTVIFRILLFRDCDRSSAES